MSQESSLTVDEIARHVGGTVIGDGAMRITGAATLDEAGPNDISWIGSPSFLSKAATSCAGALVVPRDADVASGQTTIRVSEPDLAMAQVLEMLAPPIETVPQGVHPSAIIAADALVTGAAIGPNVYVGSGAAIGTGAQLHAGVYVGSHSRIGRDCVLWPNVVVRERITIGDRVIIHPNSTIGADGFGYLQRDGRHRKIPQIGTVVIEDDVEIGANTAVDRARSGETRIGRGTKIDNLVQVAHNVKTGEHCMITGQCGIGGSASLDRHAVMGGGAGLLDHLHLGSHAQLASRALACKNVPDGEAFRGTPAVPLADFQRQTAALHKLPDALRRLRELEKRIQRLEAEKTG